MQFNTIKEKWHVDLILMAQNKTSCGATGFFDFKISFYVNSHANKLLGK
jgi:hypothetical protein